MALAGRIADCFYSAGDGNAQKTPHMGCLVSIGFIAVTTPVVLLEDLLAPDTLSATDEARGFFLFAIAIILVLLLVSFLVLLAIDALRVEHHRRAGIWGGRHGNLPLLRWPDAYIPHRGWGTVKRTRDSSSAAPYTGCGRTRIELEELAHTREPNLHEEVCSRCGRYMRPGAGAIYFGMFAHRRCFAAWVAPAWLATKPAKLR